MFFWIVSQEDKSISISKSNGSGRLSIFALGVKAYASLADRLRGDGLPDRLFLIIVQKLGHLERTWELCKAWLGAKRGDETKKDSLLAVYSLVDAGLTFDFVVFLARAEMQRVRMGLNRTDVLVFAPKGFAVYQWQKRKVFCNMGGKPLLSASHESILEYVRSLIRVGLIFPGISSLRVMDEGLPFFQDVLSSPHVFPGIGKWGGRFRSPTVYRQFLTEKYAYNGGKDPVPLPRRIDPWRSFGGKVGQDKILVTVNLRNQIYTRNRNAELDSWSRFFNHPFIKEHFHCIIFNDAENPVTIQPTAGMTFLDEYVRNNFRRSKLILKIGLHIGNVSGSSAVLMVSDTPYLYFGEGRHEDWKHCLEPGLFEANDRHILFDKKRPYQMISLKQDRMLQDFRKCLISMHGDESLLERYPARFREALGERLKEWPA